MQVSEKICIHNADYVGCAYKSLFIYIYILEMH